MTREQLLYLICPSERKNNCEDYHCIDCHLLLIKYLDEYDKNVIEQYKADTNLKDTIKDIHDNVAQEMYCKGIDDFVNRMLEEGIIGLVQYAKINEIAKQLKAGGKNE